MSDLQVTDLVFIQSYSPHGSIKGQEVLDACLMGSAFARCALIIIGDGVYQLKKSQSTSSLSVKDYSVSYGVLADYGVERIICRATDLSARSLSSEDLVIEVEVQSDEAIQALIDSAKQVLSF